MFRDVCGVCESSKIETIVDLGMHPFADTFVTAARESEADALFPLACDLCLSCGHIQSRCITDPSARYGDHDYSYTSSNSAFSRDHWEAFAREVGASTGLQAGDQVVEVGSNDGYLLDQFKKQGMAVLGVDAAPSMRPLAAERAIETITGLFGPPLVGTIRERTTAPKLIVANNVLNHADDVVAFIRAAHDLIGPDGTFVFEQPYWASGIRDDHFDQIYHEHVSYLTARSAQRMVSAAELEVSRIEVVNYHGGSLRVFAKKPTGRKCEELTKLIREEEADRIFEPTMYEEFMGRVLERRNRFLHSLYGRKRNGVAIVAVGAAAKGNTLLNFYRLDASVIDSVTDSSPHKLGKLTPGTRIPIRDDLILRDYENVAALILSWNIADTLKDKLRQINPRIQFLDP